MTPPDTPPWLAPLADWATDPTGATGARAQGAALAPRIADAMLDWLGALHAGLAHPDAAAYARADAASGSAGGGADPATLSPWLLGALSHLEEIDDGHRLGMMHPGAVTMPVILAAAAAAPHRVGTLRQAILTGYELGVRIAAALGPAHYRLCHTTATAGGFGAAAAAATLAGLDGRAMLWALGHAGTQSAGLWAFLDDGAGRAKPAHVGHAVRNGRTAAALAAAGIPGAARILEGPRGLAAAWHLSPDRTHLAPPASPAATALATATTKAWPVCGQMHHILDAVLALRPTLPPPEALTSLTLTSYPATAEIAGITTPQDLTEFRFSTAACVATLICHGPEAFAPLHPRLLHDPAVAALAARIRLASDPELAAGFPARRRCHIRIEAADGTTVERSHEGRRGDPETPLGRDALLTRYHGHSAALDETRRSAGLALVEALATAPPDHRLDPAPLAPLLAAPFGRPT